MTVIFKNILTNERIAYVEGTSYVIPETIGNTEHGNGIGFPVVSPANGWKSFARIDDVLKYGQPNAY